MSRDARRNGTAGIDAVVKKVPHGHGRQRHVAARDALEKAHDGSHAVDEAHVLPHAVYSKRVGVPSNPHNR